jgi:hypothetical protein
MKKLLKSFFVLATLAVLTFQISGCKKDCPKDDIPTKTPEEILTGQMWKIDEIRSLQNNTPTYYKRGGTSNTINYDAEVIQFKTDFTGITTTSTGSFPFTWSFVNAEKTKLKFTIQYSASFSLLVNWENIIYASNSLRYTEYYTHPSLGNTLSEGYRIPK